MTSLKTRISNDMVEEVKQSANNYQVLNRADWLPGSVNQGLSYHKNMGWTVDEDITTTRPPSQVYEVFVGVDSEYVKDQLWPPLSGDDLYHASLDSRHVKGDDLFHELPPRVRKSVTHRNKTQARGFRNRTLSYQLAVYSPQLDLKRNEVLLTGGEPVLLSDIVGRVARHCADARVSGGVHPIFRVFLIAHWTLAEIQTFKDLNSVKKAFDSVRGTFITTGAAYEVTATFEGCATPNVDVEALLHDTALLAPAGHQTLSSIGGVIGLPKLDVGGYIDRMDTLLQDDPTRFCEYAVRDAVIALAYWLAVHAITQQAIASRVFHTVGAISAGFLAGYLKRSSLNRKAFYGRGHSNFRRYDSFAVDAYHGGRNESVCVGHITERLYDLDLSGAYSIGMAHLPTLDLSRAYVTTELEPFLDVDAVGFAEVRFRFPPGVVMPCLPVKTKRGLVYPLSGVTCCTAYELCLASRLGAVLEVESGLIIPPSVGAGEPVLKRFVRDIRLERSKHPKGGLYNSFYKLILNSLYGKFAQGVNPKKHFHSRTGLHEVGGRDANTNPYFAALITGFIRTVLSELAHELTARGFLVVSMTTDGLLTNAPREFILRNVKTPFVEVYKKLVQDSGGNPDDYLEVKGSTERLFSWKTRGQYDLDGGAICALAGLQKPRGGHEAVRPWVIENVANREVKALNEIHRLASLLEVYKGSPFGDVRMLKYISTQFDFKRRPAPYKEECVFSKPWSDVKDRSEGHELVPVPPEENPRAGWEVCAHAGARACLAGWCQH